MKVFLETEAKLYVQHNIRNGIYDLIWSYMLDFENNDNPYDNRRDAIKLWKDIAVVQCKSSPVILETGRKITTQGVSHKDALHLACAIHSQCDYFISTDIKLLKKQINGIKLVSPIEFIDATEVGP
ncbi:MAG: hypothetical protein LBB56_07630 [Chitinispirillales bacterium]|jgi:predicted nucleic acid-binding protein|nr:hypothetical protein [Chitinispirillales bacterium]